MKVKTLFSMFSILWVLENQSRDPRTLEVWKSLLCKCLAVNEIIMGKRISSGMSLHQAQDSLPDHSWAISPSAQQELHTLANTYNTSQSFMIIELLSVLKI